MKGSRQQLLFVFLFGLLVGCAPAVRHLDDRRPTLPVEPANTRGPAQRLLADVTRAALRAGAQDLLVLGYGAATPGDRLESLVLVHEGSCVLFVARATETVEDLDLHLYEEDGSQLSVDESPDDLPTLLVCPEHESRLFVAARVAQGSGLVALGAQNVEKKFAKDVARAVGARNFAREPAPVEEPWPGLEAALKERRASLGGVFIDQRRVAVPVDSRVPTHLSLELPADRCLDALVLPDQDISGLNLVALSTDGRILSRSDRLGPRRALLLCTTDLPGQATLELRPYSGRGVAVVALSESRGALSTLDPDPEVTMALVGKATGAPDRPKLGRAVSTKRLSLTRGEITSYETRLSGCARMDLVANEQLFDFTAELYSEEGKLLGSTTGGRRTPIFACHHGTVRLDLEAQGRSGSLLIETRAGASAPPLLSALPLAGSRLLGRAHSTGLVSLPEEIGALSELRLSATELSRIPLSIPADHCQTVLVGGDHETRGLKARIIEDETGLTIDRAVGTDSLQVHACAKRGGHLKGTLELQTTSGSATILWASRQSKVSPTAMPGRPRPTP